MIEKSIDNTYTYSYYTHELHWDLVPLPPENGERKKIPPREHDWAEKAIERRYPESDFAKPNTNAGVLTGDPHNLTDADCDDPLALPIMPITLERFGLLENVAAISGRKSAPQSHFFFYPDEALAYYSISDPVIEDPGEAMIIEYRCRTKAGGRGHQTMIPPSIHPSGEPVEWELSPRPDHIPVVSAQKLLQAVKWTGAMVFMAKYLPTRDRHHAIRAWAKLLRDAKYSLDDSQFILRLVGHYSRNPTDDTDRHVKEVFDSPEGTHLYGWPYLEQTAGYDAKLLKKVADVLELRYNRSDIAQSASHTDVDGYITLLQSQPLESFPTKPIQYLIDGVVPKGCFVVMTGSPGSGKSTLALDYAFELAEKHWVIYLERENPREIIQARFTDRGGKTPEKLIYHGTWNKTPDGNLLEPPRPDDNLYAQLITKLGNPILIFDTLSAFSDADENDNTAMTRELRLFRKLCNLGATVILLHHCGKDPAAYYRGAEAIKGVPDMAWKLHSTIQDGQLMRVKLENFKTRTGQGKPIEYIMQNGRLVRETKGIYDILLNLLSTNPEMPQEEFAKMATTQYNFSRSTVRDSIAQALQSGDVIDVQDENDKRKHRLRANMRTVAAGVGEMRLPFEG